jgi:hypothetical protein
MAMDKLIFSFILIFCSWFASPAGGEDIYQNDMNVGSNISYTASDLYDGSVSNKAENIRQFPMTKDTLAVQIQMLNVNIASQ